MAWVARPGMTASNAFVLKPSAQAISVIGLVGDEPLGRREGFQHREGHGDVGNVARCHGDRDDPATTIGQRMDLGRSAVTRDTYRLAELPPFPPDAKRCAFTFELSSVSSSGIGPA